MNSPVMVAASMQALDLVWLSSCISRPGLRYPEDRSPR